MIKKRGAIVTYTIIGAILIIIAAGIIFLVYNNIPKKYDKEACHDSVLLRNAAISKSGGLVSEIYPLNCATEEIAVGGKDEETIKRTIADSMYDCWWMLGEGKLTFFSESGWRNFNIPGFGTAKAKCIICSVIKFDKDLKEKPKEIDLMNYLAQTSVPLKNVTYLEYLTDSQQKKLPTELDAKPINTSQDQMVVYMSIKGVNIGETVLNVLGVGGGSFMLTGAVGTLFKVGLTSTLKAAGIVGIVITALQIVTATITEATDVRAASIHCDGNVGGCNALIVAPFNATSISRLCQSIESVPA